MTNLTKNNISLKFYFIEIEPHLQKPLLQETYAFNILQYFFVNFMDSLKTKTIALNHIEVDLNRKKKCYE